MLHPACGDPGDTGTCRPALAGTEGALDMTWADFYLICFIVGFVLSLVSVLGGFFHMPGLHHHAHHGHLQLGHAHGHVHVHGAHAHTGTQQASFFNFSTLTAFLAWFGGVGYL